MIDRALSSTNNFDWVQWSDGFGSGRLYRPQSRLRRCSCGRLFLWDEHVPPREPSASKRPPAARSRWPWARRSREITEPSEDLPRAGRLTPAEMEDALSQLDGSEGAEFETEVRLWCFWNRNRQREGSEGAGVPGPQDGNTARLLELLPSDPDEAILVRGQALRDLGRFDEAATVYARMPADHRWRAQLIELAQSGRRDVAVLT